MMIEVFKTDVTEHDHAAVLIDEIRRCFSEYEVNFDLDDCDRILRVKCDSGSVEAPALIEMLNRFGFAAEVLPDKEVPVLPPVAFPFFNLLNTLHP